MVLGTIDYLSIIKSELLEPYCGTKALLATLIIKSEQVVSSGGTIRSRLLIDY